MVPRDAPPLFVEPHARRVPAEETEARTQRLQGKLAELDLDGALILQNADLYYFSGTVQQSYLYVPAEGAPTLFVRRIVERAQVESPLERVVALPSPKALPDLVRESYGSLPRDLGLELDVLPVNHFRRLERLFPGARFEDVSPAIMGLRAIKSSWEVGAIRAAATVTLVAYRNVPRLLREGLTEAELAGRVEAAARAAGHQGIIRMRGFNQEMFYGQLLTGARGAVPSFLDTPLAGLGMSPAVAQGVSFREIARGEAVVFDFVSVANGYTADFTRVFSLGPLPARLIEAYECSLRIQRAVVAMVCPGMTCRAVWEFARRMAADAGLEAHFMGHGPGQVRFLGHGVGLELDELPVLSANDLQLREGMVFALEPKFAFPGLGAVGIENTWVVTATGLELLTPAPEEIVELDPDAGGPVLA